MSRTLLILAMFCSASALAQPPVINAQSPVINNAVIDNSGGQYQGNLSVNEAAGDQQQQANARAIAIGHGASATTQIRQRLRADVDSTNDARSSIQGDSFSHGNGVLGINQSSGAANQQANAMRISISAQPQSIDDSVLKQNVALITNSDPTDSARGNRQVATSDQAFTGSRGVIQLNQSAGVGNQTANTLSVRVAD